MWVEHRRFRGYLINHEGRVVSLRKGIWRELSQYPNEKGYLRCELYTPKLVQYRVHRLVMQVFHGISTLEVNHIDGDKTNNRLENLEYVTTQQNVAHYRANKTKYRKSFESKYFTSRK